MASNFNFTTKKMGDRLHLKLYGDFDGTSACELTNSLQRYYKKPYHVYIDTDDLKTVNPFGIHILQRRIFSHKRLFFIDRRKKDFLL